MSPSVSLAVSIRALVRSSSGFWRINLRAVMPSIPSSMMSKMTNAGLRADISFSAGAAFAKPRTSYPSLVRAASSSARMLSSSSIT